MAKVYECMVVSRWKPGSIPSAFDAAKTLEELLVGVLQLGRDGYRIVGIDNFGVWMEKID